MGRRKVRSEREAQAVSALRASWHAPPVDRRSALEAALVAVQGDRLRAAQRLGVGRGTLQAWLEKWPELARKHPAPMRERFSSARHGRRGHPRRAACLATLGLAWPCTRAEVVAAWRRLAFATHPDGGGSATDFMRARRAYETALALVGSHGPTRSS